MPKGGRKMPGDDKLKQLTLRIPEDLHKKLKVKAVMDDRTITEVLTEVIRKYVEGR